MKQFLTYVSGGPFQYAIAEALRLPDEYFRQAAADLGDRRDLLCAGLAEAGFAVYPPAGTYFVTTDIRPLGHVSALDFCRELPYRAGVVAIPNVVFYDNAAAGQSQVRFAFCKRREVLADALGRLARLRQAGAPPRT